MRPSCFPCRYWSGVVLLIVVFLFCQPVSATSRGVVTTSPALDMPRVITPAFTITTEPTPAPIACPDGCSCMEQSAAVAVWGGGGFSQCSEKPCAYGRHATGSPVTQYCYRQKTAPPPPTYALLAPVQPVTTTTPNQLVIPSLVKEGAAADRDFDGTADFSDNCPDDWNMNQADSDQDDLGDACDLPGVDTDCHPECEFNAECRSGHCYCKQGWEDCNNDGLCDSLQNDWQNCGKCSNICPAGSACVKGTCTCDAGTALCPGSTTCQDLLSDINNCGGCNQKCPDGELCADGVCRIQSSAGEVPVQEDPVLEDYNVLNIDDLLSAFLQLNINDPGNAVNGTLSKLVEAIKGK